MTSLTIDTSRSRWWREPIEIWLDGIEAGWAIPAMLAVFVAIWTLFFCVSSAGIALHMDVLESWSVGRTFAWGFWKHPPLMGWVTHIWTSVFPLTDWSFELLTMINAAFALWCVDLISRRFVRGDGRAVVLLLLMLVPVYQFHAEKFNANSVLLAVWPLATYCFLRSFEQRTTFWSVATGVLCAAAMLGKYYSIFLIAGFVFAALMHPQRAAYLRSRAPWLAVLAGLVAIAPHLWWLVRSDFAPFHYAMSGHGGHSLLPSMKGAVLFLLTNCGYLAVPAAALIVMTRAKWPDYLKDFKSLDPGLRLLALAFAATMVLPAIVVLAIGSDLPASWHFQGLFLAVLIAVCAPRFAIPRFEVVNLTLLVLALSIGALVASPLYALYNNAVPSLLGRNFYIPASELVTKEWRHVYGTPLARVSGDDGLAFAIAFYSPDHPFYGPPSIDKGGSILCFAHLEGCRRLMSATQARFHDAKQISFVLQSELWGIPGTGIGVLAIFVPPLFEGATGKP